jgi:hypothetical protein
MPVLAPATPAAPADTTTPALEAIFAALGTPLPEESDLVSTGDYDEPAVDADAASPAATAGPFGHGTIRLHDR